MIRYITIFHIDKGVTKFLKFAKLIDVILTPKWNSNKIDTICYYSFFQKKFVYFNDSFEEICNILMYLSIRFDFNVQNDFVKNQQIIKNHLKNSELKVVKELIQLYGIENLSLYFAKIYNMNLISEFKFNLVKFLQYDIILFKPDLTNFVEISDFLQNPVDLDSFNPNCEVVQNYFNDFTFLFIKERPLIFCDKFDELPLESIPILDVIH